MEKKLKDQVVSIYGNGTQSEVWWPRWGKETEQNKWKHHNQIPWKENKCGNI